MLHKFKENILKIIKFKKFYENFRKICKFYEFFIKFYQKMVIIKFKLIKYLQIYYLHKNLILPNFYKNMVFLKI